MQAIDFCGSIKIPGTHRPQGISQPTHNYILPTHYFNHKSKSRGQQHDINFSTETSSCSPKPRSSLRALEQYQHNTGRLQRRCPRFPLPQIRLFPRSLTQQYHILEIPQSHSNPLPRPNHSPSLNEPSLRRTPAAAIHCGSYIHHRRFKPNDSRRGLHANTIPLPSNPPHAQLQHNLTTRPVECGDVLPFINWQGALRYL